MKSRLTAVLSVSGVLVAGSSAALVNTQVLRHTSESAMSGDTSGAQAIGDAPVGTVVLGVDTTSPVTSGGATLPAGTDAVGVSAPVSTATAYRVGSSGTVVLDAAGGVLTIVSVTPAAGWTFAESSQANATHARIVFETTTTQVVFDANLLYGVVGTSVAVTSLDDSSGGTTGDSSGNATYGGSAGNLSTTTTTEDVEDPTTTTIEEHDDGVVDDD